MGSEMCIRDSELRSLSSQGFEVKDLGLRTLKGLENPEYIYLMYPHSLASRLVVQQQRADAEASVKQQEQQQQQQQRSSSGDGGLGGGGGNASGTSPSLFADVYQPSTKTQDSRLAIDTDTVWDLWSVSLRLEMLCSSLESSGVMDGDDGGSNGGGGNGGAGGSTAGRELKAPETALLERMKSRGGEITDRFLINFVEHQISRIEVCRGSLSLPFCSLLGLKTVG